MTVFTSTIPDYLLELLDKKSKKLALPKNKLIERALKIYLEQLNKAEYRKSYQKMANDTDILQIVVEGMSDYLIRLVNLWDKEKYDLYPLTNQVKNYQGNLVLSPNSENKLTKKSEILISLIRSVSTERLVKKIGNISNIQTELVKKYLN